jgi:hypothetical protein
MVVLFNTLNFERFEKVSCVSNDGNEFSGVCMTPQMGITCIDKTFLEKGMQSSKIEFINGD